MKVDIKIEETRKQFMYLSWISCNILKFKIGKPKTEDRKKPNGI